MPAARAPKQPDRIECRLRWQVTFHQNPHKKLSKTQTLKISPYRHTVSNTCSGEDVDAFFLPPDIPQTRENLFLWNYLPFGLIRPRFLVLSANCRALQTKLMVAANFCGIVAGLGKQPIASDKRMGTRSSRLKNLSGKNRCWMLGPVI